MAKTKYVKQEVNWSSYVGYRDPDNDGWQVSFDGNYFWIGDETVPELINFLSELNQEASK